MNIIKNSFLNNNLSSIGYWTLKSNNLVTIDNKRNLKIKYKSIGTNDKKDRSNFFGKVKEFSEAIYLKKILNIKNINKIPLFISDIAYLINTRNPRKILCKSE